MTTPPPFLTRRLPRHNGPSGLSQSQQVEAVFKALSTGKEESLTTLFFDCAQVSHKALIAIASRPRLAQRCRDAAAAEAAQRHSAHPLEKALCDCCARANHDKAALLIQLGALLGNSSSNALLKAIEAAPLDPSLSLAKRLLSHGLSPNAPSSSGALALNLAFFFPPALRDRAFEILLNAGANPFLTSSGRSGPLSPPGAHPALFGASRKALACGSSAFFLAAFFGPNETLNQFLAALKNPDDLNIKDERGRSALALAALSGSVERLRAIAGAGASLVERDSYGNSVLHAACDEGGSASVARALIDLGAPLEAKNFQGATPLSVAVRAYRGAEPPSSRADESGVIETLLAAGAQPDCSDDRGETPLKEAISLTDWRPFRLLLEAGANPNGAASDPSPPLYLACWGQRVDCCAALLDAGANPNQTNIEGKTPAGAAISSGNAFLLELLLQRGAHLSQLDPNGRSLLHLACLDRSPELCEILLGAGADPLAKDHDGQTPKDLIKLGSRPSPGIQALRARLEKEELGASTRTLPLAPPRKTASL